MIKNPLQLLALSTLLTAACGADVDAPGGPGDDDPDTGEPSVTFVATTIHDERGDEIDFATGEPIHAHRGEVITLDGNGCPAVYKHAYLLDAGGPRFGRETTPNLLSWQVALRGLASIDLAQAAYRVRDFGQEVLLDWTPLPPLEAGTATIALHRDGDAAVPALGDREGKLQLDVRIVDLAGVETITTACWEHHPIAAPLDVERAQPEPDGLAAMTLLADSPISRLLAATTRVPVFGQRILQPTSEPVQLVIDIAQPTGSFAKRIVEDHLVRATGEMFFCGTEIEIINDPHCTVGGPMIDPPDTTAAGPLASGQWSVALLDERTNAAVAGCTTNGLRLACTLPPRSSVEAPDPYRVVVSVRDVRDLYPAPAGPFAEHTLLGRTYTGLAPVERVLCHRGRYFAQPDGPLHYYCLSYTEFFRLLALDHARLAFDPVSFAITVAPTSSVVATPPAHVAASEMSTAPFVWDAGDDDLPGPQ